MYGGPCGGQFVSKERNTVPSDGQASGLETLTVIFNVPVVAGSLPSLSPHDTKNIMEKASVAIVVFLKIFIFTPCYIYLLLMSPEY